MFLKTNHFWVLAGVVCMFLRIVQCPSHLFLVRCNILHLKVEIV